MASAQVLSITKDRKYNYGDLVWVTVANHIKPLRGKVMAECHSFHDIWVHYIVRLNKYPIQGRYITVRHDNLKPRIK